MQTCRRPDRVRGFSLIDGVVGVLLLALLAAVVGPALGGLVRVSERQETQLNHLREVVDETPLAEAL